MCLTSDCEGQVSGGWTDYCCFNGAFCDVREHALCRIDWMGKPKLLSVISRRDDNTIVAEESPWRFRDERGILSEQEGSRMVLLLSGQHLMPDERFAVGVVLCRVHRVCLNSPDG